MSIKFAIVAAGAASLLTLLPPSTAQAASCGSYSVPGTNKDVVFGEAANAAGVGNGKLAICSQPVGGTTKAAQTYYEFAAGTCGSSTPASDYFELFGTSAGDRMSPLFTTPGLISCGASGKYIKPFAWSFAVSAVGNGGGDFIFGTPAADTLQSGFNGSYAADGALDILCGYGGNDWLIGDGDNAVGTEECLEGGAGTADYCDAVYFTGLANDTNAGDAYYTCEFTYGSFGNNYRATGSCNCNAGYQYFWVTPAT